MRTYRIGLLMSQCMGHTTHAQRMRREIEKHPEIQPEWMPVLPWADDRWQKLPVIQNNLTALSAFRAREQLQRQTKPFNALLCHTPEAALFLGKYMDQIPTILSMDSTPINMDSIGHGYGHRARLQSIERVKHFLTTKCFRRASHLVTWSRWAKDSLINDYGLSEQRITVNPPGVDLAFWKLNKKELANSQDDELPRVLFVGRDFRRKGGETLMQCAASMKGKCVFDIITKDPIPSAQGNPDVRIHRGLKPDTPELLALYRDANIFVLPTSADCYSLVAIEAMAMRLPVVTSPVGGIPEIVVHGETGLLIPPNEPEALARAIRALTEDPTRRRAMGDAGRARVEQHFDGARNYGQMIALIKSIADGVIAT
jgi:glycosyltransferase involved in cell wall biosynthesis